jgi:hypothetical protein
MKSRAAADVCRLPLLLILSFLLLLFLPLAVE